MLWPCALSAVMAGPGSNVCLLKAAALLMAIVFSTQLGATASSETCFYNISHALENLVPMTECTILSEIQPFALILVHSV